MKKFGTFGGVFTPSILTILGVIMYLRMGWVIGNAGTLTLVFGIILLAHVVSISTGLSISSIATDKKIKSGGIYYILSRSLGFPFGGAIGLTLYAATALSISLYLVGFSESLLLVVKDWLHIEEITTNHLRLVGSLSLIAIVTVGYISTSFAIKTQYIILSAIVLSLISIFLGTSEGKGFDFSEVNLDNVPGFAVIFGVFFPAVTGFTAGVAMSGDLKNPAKSIPWGTMLAIFTGLIIYSGLAIFIFYKIPGAELIKNTNALVEFSWIPQLVIAGIWGATLSSALGGILGGPRILQSMSLDRITPRIFGKGVGKNNEPRNALLLTFFLAEAGILIGELNVIAGIVAMFYMAAYLVINLSCFLEKWASPDFRPKFKINIFIPLIGLITIFLLMIQLNLVATLVAIVIIAAVFIYLTRKQLVLSSGDVWSSVWSSIVKMGLRNLDKKPKNKRNWEPNILLFSGGTEARPHLIDISKAIAGKGGMISNFDLIENPTAKTLFPKQDQALKQDNLKEGIIFHRKQECNSLFKGIEAIASTYGFSGIEPNTTLMGWARNTKDPIWFADMNKKLKALDYNILYLDYDKNKGFGSYSKIDIWWNNINNVSELTIQIAKRILTSNDWNDAEIRILFLNTHHNKHAIESLILKQFASLRIDFPFQIINNEVEKKSFYDVVKQHSTDADLIIVEIPEINNGEEASFVQETNEFLSENATTLLVSASNSFTAITKELLNMEHSYKQNRELLVLKPNPIEHIRYSGFNVLDEIVKQIDESINEINHLCSSSIYTSLTDVYKSLIGLLKERFEQYTDKSALSFLALKQSLIEDLLSNQRFNPVAEDIKSEINHLLNRIKKIINDSPKIIRRIYDAQNLICDENDSEELCKTKRRLQGRKAEKIQFLKTLRSYYSNEYLEKLSEHLLFIGTSTKIINESLIEWITNLDANKPVNFNAIEKELGSLYSSSGNQFLNHINTLSRELSNSVLAATNSLETEYVDLKNNRKTKKSKRIEAGKIISTYSQVWLNNTQLLTNQLSLSMQLRSLEIKTTKSITSASKTVEKELLRNALKEIKKCSSKLDSITIEDINVIKKELYNISNQINIDNVFNSIQLDLENDITLINDAINVIAQNDLNQFDSIQGSIAPSVIDARRIAKSVIENEIIASLVNLFQESINKGRTEITKIQNVLDLLKYDLLNKSGDEKNTKIIFKKVSNQLDESTKNIEIIRNKQSIETDQILGSLKSQLTLESIADKADSIGISFQKINKNKISDPLKKLAEKWANRLNALNIESIDKVADSKFQYRTKSLQNAHTKFSDFSDMVSLNKQIEKQLPFYYNQLFTGKQTAQTEFLENRKAELLAVKKAVERFNEGKNGAILFTGYPLSGKTYLMQNAVNLYCPKNIISIPVPIYGVIEGSDMLNNALANATGFDGDAVTILRQVKKKSTIIFEDLELWWTRSESGSACLLEILNLIEQFGNTHLFVIDCNSYFYEHIRQYLPIDEQLLATIITSSLPISEIEKMIMDRHRSGGMKFIWKDTEESKLGSREKNKLFRKITAQTDGSIGMAFYMWIGNITNIEKDEIHLSNFDNHSLPLITNPVWENMLMQILMHKKISVKRLKEVYRFENELYIDNALRSLIRTGLLVKTTSNSYSVSPYILPYFIDYLAKKH